MTGLSKFIRNISDYPKPGILFKDITPLLGNAPVFNAVIEVYAQHYKGETQNPAVTKGFDACPILNKENRSSHLFVQRCSWRVLKSLPKLASNLRNLSYHDE